MNTVAEMLELLPDRLRTVGAGANAVGISLTFLAKADGLTWEVTGTLTPDKWGKVPQFRAESVTHKKPYSFTVHREITGAYRLMYRNARIDERSGDEYQLPEIMAAFEKYNESR